jgi:hypothetical protein
MLDSLNPSAEFIHDLKPQHCARCEIYTVKMLRIENLYIIMLSSYVTDSRRMKEHGASIVKGQR